MIKKIEIELHNPSDLGTIESSVFDVSAYDEHDELLLYDTTPEAALIALDFADAVFRRLYGEVAGKIERSDE